MNTRRLAILAAAGLSVIALCATLLALAGRHQVTVTQNEIQQRIDTALGQRLADQQRGAVAGDLVISSARLKLADDKMAVAIEASGNKFGHAVAVNAKADGKLRYESLSGSFYFQPQSIELTKLEVDQGTVQQGVSKLIDKWISSPTINQHKGEIATRVDVWVRDRLQRLAERGLERYPVYTLPSTLKGRTAQMLIQRVEVKNGSIVVQMSYLRFAGYCLLYTLLLAAGVALVLAMVFRRC
jgi:hypothetical protein